MAKRGPKPNLRERRKLGRNVDGSKRKNAANRRAKWGSKPFAMPKNPGAKRIAEMYRLGKITLEQHDEFIAKRLAKIDETEPKLQSRIQSVEDSNPFYAFTPNTGELSPESRDFLCEYLKPEDVPTHVTGQKETLLATDPIIGVSGGNQSGKTTTVCIRTFIQATGEIPIALENEFPRELLPTQFPQRWRISGVSDSTLASTVFPTYKKWVPRKFLKRGLWSESFSAKYNTLSLYDPMGKQDKVIATIEFKTDRQDTETRQGPPLHGVGYDEEPRKANFEEDLLRFVTADRLNVLFGFTPTKGLSWTGPYFLNPEPGVRLFKICSVANRYAKLDVVRRICDQILRSHGKEEAYKILKMRLLGEFISLSGLVYGSVFERNYHVIPPFWEDLNKWQQREYFVLSGWDPHLCTATAGVFLLVDREGVGYVDYCYDRQSDTDEIKEGFHEIINSRNYRMGWSTADKSSNTSIIAFGGRNIFKELSQGDMRIPALRTSEKYTGSIRAGVDTMKRALKNNMLFIVDRPENRKLVTSFQTLERDTYVDEDKKGEKDEIREGPHHLHAALRYIYQYPVSWIPEVVDMPEYEPINEVVNY
jgi:phage terminase large subunit-like protein